MKIVLVGSGVVPIPPTGGGATELIIFELSKALAKNNHTVKVFDIKTENNEEHENFGGAAYERFAVPRFGNVFLLRASELLFGARSLVRTLRESPDVVHCQTVFSSLPFAISKMFVPGKFVYTSHNPAWTDGNRDVFNRIILKLEGFVVKMADTVITVSDEMKNGILRETRVNEKKIHVIHNFVDRRMFKPCGKSWKNNMHISGPVVIFVGKLSKTKGVEYLIRSAALVKEKIPDVKFVLVGPVNFEFDADNHWKKLVEDTGLDDTVIFAGPASTRELPRAYSSADVFCFPTMKEAFGIVIVEAMACGLPVVTTDLPVTREVAGNAALFSKIRDERDIARNIILLLKNKKLHATMRTRSISRAGMFEISAIMKKYEDFYLSEMADEGKI
jgi:glycosyltransferase involved in cell wall biosynthesis